MEKKQKSLSQIQNFIKTARELGCDESEEAFDTKLKALMTVKPMTQKQVKKKAKRSE